jgi:molecular chaperone GrpE
VSPKQDPGRNDRPDRADRGARDKRDAEPERVVIRDNRKIDRGAAATAAAASGAAADAGDDPAEAVSPEQSDVPMVEAALLDERTHDLQRVQAEYANYRKRADRERLAAGDLAVSRVLADLLPVLDDLDRARAHGDLTGGLKAVADQLDSVFTKLGLVSFGEVGDPFDPELHEAVLHDESPDVTEPTCTTVMRPGYKHNDRLLRPAMVGVSDPAEPAADVAAEVESAPVAADENDDENE